MKYTIHVFFLVLLMSSCKTTKEIPAEVEEKIVSEKMEDVKLPEASEEKTGRSERLRKPKIDPEQIVAQLNLNESQEKSFLDFWEKNQAKMDKLRSESNGDRTAIRERMKSFRESSKAEIEKILTPEQFAKYKQILAKDRMKSRRGR